jgi:hypothetical protein
LFSIAGVFALAFSGVDAGWLFVGVMMAALICGVLAAAFRPIQARRTEWAEDDWDDYYSDANNTTPMNPTDDTKHTKYDDATVPSMAKSVGITLSAKSGPDNSDPIYTSTLRISRINGNGN